MTLAAIGIGVNLGDAPATVRAAIGALGGLPTASVVAVADLYATRPLGGPEQPAYLNTAVLVDVAADPRALLAALHEIEARFGRVREERWGPRTLDLDILLLDRPVDEPGLVVPHARLAGRRFALEPLLDLGLGERRLADGRTVAETCASLPDQGVRRLGPATTATMGGFHVDQE